ncbi:MAG: hypothetical protein ACR2HP_02735 [Ilumatobacteraceae bacterium]
MRRFVTSLSPRPSAPEDEVWAESMLRFEERELWRQMANADRRHAVTVARRFLDRRPDATRAEVAGALLHDVGKVDAGLGTFGRVVATVVGARTKRFRTYHDHEAIGARMAAEAGADQVTIDLIAGDGPAAADLAWADHV